MAKKSKRIRAALGKVSSEPLPLTEAVAKLQSYDATKFDQSVEIAIRLGIDNTQADQIVRGSIVLPHGIGKQQRALPRGVGLTGNVRKRPTTDDGEPEERQRARRCTGALGQVCQWQDRLCACFPGLGGACLRRED